RHRWLLHLVRVAERNCTVSSRSASMAGDPQCNQFARLFNPCPGAAPEVPFPWCPRFLVAPGRPQGQPAGTSVYRAYTEPAASTTRKDAPKVRPEDAGVGEVGAVKGRLVVGRGGGGEAVAPSAPTHYRTQVGMRLADGTGALRA